MQETNQIIIHIAGPSGSGKTTWGNQLKETYHNKIIVKDTDDLHQEYQNLKTNMDYQDYIYHFIKQNPNIPIIFVGLVNSPTHVLDLNTNHKFYIEIPLAQN